MAPGAGSRSTPAWQTITASPDAAAAKAVNHAPGVSMAGGSTPRTDAPTRPSVCTNARAWTAFPAGTSTSRATSAGGCASSERNEASMGWDRLGQSAMVSSLGCCFGINRPGAGPSGPARRNPATPSIEAAEGGASSPPGPSRTRPGRWSQRSSDRLASRSSARRMSPCARASVKSPPRRCSAWPLRAKAPPRDSPRSKPSALASGRRDASLVPSQVSTSANGLDRWNSTPALGSSWSPARAKITV